MPSVTSTEFVKNFGHHSHIAQHEPVAVTNHGRINGYYVSAREFAAMQAMSRRSYTIETLPEELFQEIINSKVDPKYNYLNDLLNDSES